MSSLEDLVPLLDHLLTKRPMAETNQTAVQQQRLLDPEAFLTMSDAYYLSDGGYSRIKASEETGRLILSGVSRKEVVARWNDNDVRTVITEIETLLRSYLQQAGFLDD